MDIQIIVAAHKPYQMPKDPIYLPLQVGAAGHENIGYMRDDTGENISARNPSFCELTGLYWAWKNVKADYVGLVHYRRYFTVSKKLFWSQDSKFNHVLTGKQAEELLRETDVIVPNKRNYYIETLYDHYCHTLYPEPLEITRQIIAEKDPAYLAQFDQLKMRKSAHMFNMMVMRKDLLNGYCEWLFAILFELEKRMNHHQYSAFHARFYGRISELLLDVYLSTNHIPYTEVRVIDMEHINWIKKGYSFIRAKFTGKKYEKSF